MNYEKILATMLVLLAGVIGFVIWQGTAEQQKYEKSLGAEQRARYKTLVQEIRSAKGGDILVAKDGRLYISHGRGDSGIQFQKFPEQVILDTLSPEYAARGDIVGVIRRNSSDYETFRMRFYNQTR